MPKISRSGAFGGIAKLRDHYKNDDPSLRKLDEEERKLRDAIEGAKLSEHPLVQRIIETGRREIKRINMLLLGDLELDDKTRHGLVYERDCHEFYLSRFVPELCLRQKESTEKWVEQQLASIEHKTS